MIGPLSEVSQQFLISIFKITEFEKSNLLPAACRPSSLREEADKEDVPVTPSRLDSRRDEQWCMCL